MKQELRRAAVGVAREGFAASAIVRAVVGTVTAVLIVWRAGLPWPVLVVVPLVYLVYVLLRRVFQLERRILQLEGELDRVRAEAAKPAPDPVERRRVVRDGLQSFRADAQRLMTRARIAFDAGPESWNAWLGDMRDFSKGMNDFVREHLGEPEFAEITTPVPAYPFDSRDDDAEYQVAVAVLSARRDQLQHFIERLSLPV